MLINKCGSPLGAWEIHCNEEQMQKIKLMFEQEMNMNRTDSEREP
jgi:hypothetical protein